MSRILVIARREWLEQLRQPFMVGVIGSLFAIIAILSVLVLVLLDTLAGDIDGTVNLMRWLPGGEADPEGTLASLTAGTVGVANFLVFSQLLGMVAVLAGHSVLHDHQSHTLPFLLLAPVRRAELLLGKVLGAMGTPPVLYLVVCGLLVVMATSLSVTDPVADRLPPSPAWLVAFFLGGPIWAACVASVCAIVSTLASDVRTAQQVVWFVMFFATLLCGYMLATALPEGVLVQLGVAGVGAAATAGTIALGSQVISRDLTR